MREEDKQYWCHVDGKYTDVKPLDDLFRGIKAHINSVEQRNAYLEEENKKLKDEHFKNEKLNEIQNELDAVRESLYRGFPISKEEDEKIKKWIQKHEEECHGANYSKGKYRNVGAIGGAYTYEFVPTSLGTIGTIKCTCGAKFTFSDDL